jgi:hypothetical protein
MYKSTLVFLKTLKSNILISCPKFYYNILSIQINCESYLEFPLK